MGTATPKEECRCLIQMMTRQCGRVSPYVLADTRIVSELLVHRLTVDDLLELRAGARGSRAPRMLEIGRSMVSLEAERQR